MIIRIPGISYNHSQYGDMKIDNFDIKDIQSYEGGSVNISGEYIINWYNNNKFSGKYEGIRWWSALSKEELIKLIENARFLESFEKKLKTNGI